MGCRRCNKSCVTYFDALYRCIKVSNLGVPLHLKQFSKIYTVYKTETANIFEGPVLLVTTRPMPLSGGFTRGLPTCVCMDELIMSYRLLTPCPIPDQWRGFVPRFPPLRFSRHIVMAWSFIGLSSLISPDPRPTSGDFAALSSSPRLTRHNSVDSVPRFSLKRNLHTWYLHCLTSYIYILCTPFSECVSFSNRLLPYVITQHYFF